MEWMNEWNGMNVMNEWNEWTEWINGMNELKNEWKNKWKQNCVVASQIRRKLLPDLDNNKKWNTFWNASQLQVDQYVLDQRRIRLGGISPQEGVTEYSVSYEAEILDHL